MSASALLVLCAQACLLQNVYSQSLGAGRGVAPTIGTEYELGCEPVLAADIAYAPSFSTGIGYGYGLPGPASFTSPAAFAGPAAYAAGPAYGGAGIGDVSVTGEIPVTGISLVAGQNVYSQCLGDGLGVAPNIGTEYELGCGPVLAADIAYGPGFAPGVGYGYGLPGPASFTSPAAFAGPAAYAAGPAYGGAGIGDVSVTGEIPVTGISLVAGQVIAGQCLGNGLNSNIFTPGQVAAEGMGWGGQGFGYGAPFGAPCAPAPLIASEWAPLGPATVPSSNGGGFIVTSSSPISPIGVSVISDNEYAGPLAVGGQLPFLGTVGLEGTITSTGSGAVSYSCGNGNVGIVSENILPSAAEIGYGNGLAPGFGFGPGFGGPSYGFGPGNFLQSGLNKCEAA
ncbi:unnamed protein product [Parnassius apollo]|uniref:(apollo) hypothetical protein n=1 Tax=Parnassius apollo TaxID=110799 RepID=A0A8S3WGT0_PARAO|nr:unnamed protein product [Parnassius apollo]